MIRKPLLLGGLLVPLFSISAPTQQWTVVLSPDGRMVMPDANAYPSLEDCDDHETYVVTPTMAGGYKARPFHTFSTWNILLGDQDGDGDLSDGTNNVLGDCNVLLIRRRAPNADLPPYYPGDFFVSHQFVGQAYAATSTGGIVTIENSDVFRARNGQIEFFVLETELVRAMGDPAGNVSLDAMCQDSTGSIFFSILGPVTLGTTSYDDGDVIYIPGSAITYDANGLIASIAANSARVFATELQINAIVTNAGTFRQDGTMATTVSDLSGIDVDPNGGSWTSPNDPTLIGPNLIFVSNLSQFFDNIWSTAINPANGQPGSVAVINGVPMGYTAGTPNGTVTGVGIDITGTGQDALNGLCVIPAQNDWIAVESPLSGDPVGATKTFTIEVGRAQANSPIVLVFDGWSNDFIGGWVDGIPAGVFGFAGNPFLDIMTPIVVQVIGADANGYASLSFDQPVGVPPGIDVIYQCAGFAAGGAFALGGSGNLTTL